MIAANRDFVRECPVATKRAVRAIVKSANICALEPERTARHFVDTGYAARYDYALQAMQELPYGKWREYDPEDTVPFLALRLHDIGMIKTSPNKLIAQGTDWRFIRELKKEAEGIAHSVGSQLESMFLSRITVSQCHPEAVAEGSRLRK